MAHQPKEKDKEKEKEKENEKEKEKTAAAHGHGHGHTGSDAHPHPPEFVKELKKALLEKRNQIRGNINLELNDLRQSEGHHLADMEDLASETTDESTAYHIIELEQAELSQIERALQLIEEGEYGRCEDCGEPINVERLRALPFATLCIDCKKEAERRTRD
jgi:DnaK suppressor protein